MMRKPRRCRPTGTEPPALSGSRDAPTTAIVVVSRRISSEALATLLASMPRLRIFLRAQTARLGRNGSPDAADPCRRPLQLHVDAHREAGPDRARDRPDDRLGARLAFLLGVGRRAGQPRAGRMADLEGVRG